MLLSEIHHRVKNNLAIVIGLLELEKMNFDLPESEKLFSRSIARLHQISAIHKQLYDYNNLSSIPFEGFLKKSLEVENYMFENIRVEQIIQHSCYDAIISINQAVPLSMMMNELYFAIDEYLDEDGMSGHIHMETSCTDNDVVIRISSRSEKQKNKDVFKNLPENILFDLFLNQANAKMKTNKQGDLLKITFKLTQGKGSSGSLPENYTPEYDIY